MQNERRRSDHNDRGGDVSEKRLLQAAIWREEVDGFLFGTSLGQGVPSACWICDFGGSVDSIQMLSDQGLNRLYRASATHVALPSHIARGL
jgi:hypothetical protein